MKSRVAGLFNEENKDENRLDYTDIRKIYSIQIYNEIIDNKTSTSNFEMWDNYCN